MITYKGKIFVKSLLYFMAYAKRKKKKNFKYKLSPFSYSNTPLLAIVLMLNQIDNNNNKLVSL